MKIYHWIIACCLLLPLGGCSNWLDVIPEDSVDEKDLFSTGEGYRNALNGVYRQMSQTSMYGQQMSWGFIDVLGQLYNTQKLSNYSAYGIAGKNYAYRDETVKSVIQVIWSNTYNSIANCNNIVGRITGEDPSKFRGGEAEQHMIQGEALALRAFLHFDLLRMFGPVYKDNPTSKRITYRTEFSKEIKELQPSNVVMDSIISDLKKAETLLTGTDPLNFEFPVSDYEEEDMGGDRFLVYRHKRMNLYAVKALLARVYLYAGNKTEAENYANQVIGSGYFDLIGDASDVLRSKEIVFSVYVDDFDQQVATITNGNTYYISKEEFLDELFDVANDGSNDLRIREGVGFDYGTHGITMRKYKQENLWASTEGTVVLIRLSEMYYILAECAATPEEAAGYLNKVREMRGIDPTVCTEANRLNEIEKEYRKEFYGEGQLFYFYKRNGYTTFLHSPLSNMTESNYMFSWPDDETLFGKTN